MQLHCSYRTIVTKLDLQEDRRLVRPHESTKRCLLTHADVMPGSDFESILIFLVPHRTLGG